MKKLICCVLAAVVLLGLASVAYAAETTCAVTADSVTAGAGQEVSVSVKVTGNPGFTNFGVFLQYDSEKLTLTRVEAVAGEISGVNLASEPREGSPCCYVTSASATAVTGDVVLFTAVFTTADNFTGSAQVTPVVSYIRDNTAVFSVFEEITATTTSGTVTASEEGFLGDVDGDGEVTMSDMQLIYRASRGELALTETQEKTADVDLDGEVTMSDMQLVYQYCIGTLQNFPDKNETGLTGESI